PRHRGRHQGAGRDGASARGRQRRRRLRLDRQAEERSKMWQARHDAAWAAKAAKPGWGMWATDVCVPISTLAECILETQKDIQANDLYAPIVGHVGDGNFHLTMMVDPSDPAYLP